MSMTPEPHNPLVPAVQTGGSQPTTSLSNLESSQVAGLPVAPRPVAGSGTAAASLAVRKRRRWSWRLAVRLLIIGVFVGGTMLLYRLPTVITELGLHLVPASGQLLVADGSGPAGSEPGDILENVEGTRLVFVPLERDFADQRQPLSIATVAANGRFQLKTLAGKTGAVRGRHLVFVLPPDQRKSQNTNQPAKADQSFIANQSANTDRIAEPQPSHFEPDGFAPEVNSDWERRYAEFLLDPTRWFQRQQPSVIRHEVDIPYLGTRHLEIQLGRVKTGASKIDSNAS